MSELKKKLSLKEDNIKVTKFTLGNKKVDNKNNEENDENKNDNNENDNIDNDNNENNNNDNNENDKENIEFPSLVSLSDDDLLNSNDLNEKKYECQLEMDYKYFMKNVFNENFFKERIIFSYLPVSIKGFVCNIPKIVLNVCGNNILTYKYDKKSDDFKIILKALLVCIIIHEIIHLCRRENKDKIYKNDQYTPKEEDKNYEGGKSLIYHIFNAFVVVYIDLEFAKAILDLKSWEKNGEVLKQKYTKLGKNEESKQKHVELNGGIKCYNSEEEPYNIEEDLFNYYYCC